MSTATQHTSAFVYFALELCTEFGILDPKPAYLESANLMTQMKQTRD